MPCLTRLLAGAQDDPSSPTPDASTLRKSQMGLSVNAKQFVVITPKRNLKCEIVDANDSAQEWVDVINSIAIDGAIARSGSKKFSLMRRSDASRDRCCLTFAALIVRTVVRLCPFHGP